MSGVTFAHPGLVHLVWVAVAVTAMLAWLELRGREEDLSELGDVVHYTP